jgi:hypothetical protein
MPTVPVNITPLPTPPSRDDSVNFTTRADAFLGALPTFTTQTNAIAANVFGNASEALGSANAAATSANAAQADRILAQSAQAAITAQSPAANAAAAAASAAEAAVYASQAQAVSPDSPVRLNTRFISADFSIGSDYNASSVGPITILDGVTVTVGDNSTWSIN